MSYLGPLRLHFAGRFQAAVSTVNNDPLHYDTANFEPSYQLMQTRTAPNGWFNPRGSGVWRLLGCSVTAAWLDDGTAAATTDPIRTSRVADSDRAAPAKLVDLDTEQQLVSEIWGLEVRICDRDGKTYLRGQYEPAAFMDIWDRATGGGGDVGAAAVYQSVLTDLEWGDISASPFLQRLHALSPDVLSIKFNVDGINLDFRSDQFMTGRVVGTIGASSDGEPRHFVPGRQFMSTPSPNPIGGFYTPDGGINFCVGVVDESRGKVILDLGNALPTTTPGGALVNIGTITLCYQEMTANGPVVTPLDTVPYLPRPGSPPWYQTTAGVVELPASRSLTQDELAAVKDGPLLLQRTPVGGTALTAISEPPTGVYVRSDRYVYRLDPDESAEITLYATRFGKPYADARIMLIEDLTQLQSNGSMLGQPPEVGDPPEALDFPGRVVSDANGIARAKVTARAPGNPRVYIDGQIYGIRPVLEETVMYSLSTGQAYPFNQWVFISLLVWDTFVPATPITWHGDIKPIFQQYANLYPVMDLFLDLGGFEDVCAHREWLRFAFELDLKNPNSMPVTRDLSRAKRRAIVRWLTDVDGDGKPLEGVVAPAASARAVEGAVPEPAAAAPPDFDPAAGGKAAAASRRRGLKRRFARP